MGHAAIRWGIVEERTRPAYAPRRSEVSVLTSFFASMQGVLDQAQGVLDQARMRQDPAWDASPASHTFIRKTRHARERALGPKTDILAGSCGGRGAHSGEAGVDGSGGGLLDDPAEDGKHGNAAVLKLSLAENLHVEHLGEAKGVEANVTGEGAVKVGGLLEEGDRLGEGALEHRHLGGGDRCTKQHAHVASADDCHLYRTLPPPQPPPQKNEQSSPAPERACATRDVSACNDQTSTDPCEYPGCFAPCCLPALPS